MSIKLRVTVGDQTWLCAGDGTAAIVFAAPNEACLNVASEKRIEKDQFESSTWVRDMQLLPGDSVLIEVVEGESEVQVTPPIDVVINQRGSDGRPQRVSGSQNLSAKSEPTGS